MFVLLVFTDYQNLDPNRSNPVAAEVGRNDITFVEFERSYRNTEAQYREMYGDAFSGELAEQLQLPVQTLENLINERLLVMEAERLGLVVSNEELQAAILDIPGLTDGAGNFIGARQYQDLLRANRFSVDEFESNLKRGLLVQKLQDALREIAHVTDGEVEQRAREDAERAAIRYIRVAANRFADDAAPTDEEAVAHFEQNRADFRLPERRRVGYLLVSTNTVPGGTGGQRRGRRRVLRGEHGAVRGRGASARQPHSAPRETPSAVATRPAPDSTNCGPASRPERTSPNSPASTRTTRRPATRAATWVTSAEAQ